MNSSKDPMEFVRSMWGTMGFSVPGMVTPTFSTDDLEKRITDLKAVEGWLQMNLSLLQMSIQGLEMQKTTLSTVKAMHEIVSSPGEEDERFKDAPTVGETLHRAALWPLNVMQQMQEHLQQHLQEPEKAEAPKAAESEKSEPKEKAPPRAASTRKAPARKPRA
jgi:hypothetical protein